MALDPFRFEEFAVEASTSVLLQEKDDKIAELVQQLSQLQAKNMDDSARLSQLREVTAFRERIHKVAAQCSASVNACSITAAKLNTFLDEAIDRAEAQHAEGQFANKWNDADFIEQLCPGYGLCMPDARETEHKDRRARADSSSYPC